MVLRMSGATAGTMWHSGASCWEQTGRLYPTTCGDISGRSGWGVEKQTPHSPGAEEGVDRVWITFSM